MILIISNVLCVFLPQQKYSIIYTTRTNKVKKISVSIKSATFESHTQIKFCPLK